MCQEDRAATPLGRGWSGETTLNGVAAYSVDTSPGNLTGSIRSRMEKADVLASFTGDNISQVSRLNYRYVPRAFNVPKYFLQGKLDSKRSVSFLDCDFLHGDVELV